MTSSSETTRLTAHVLLDALSAFDDLSNPAPDPAIRLALRRLEEVDAVTLTYDDETETRTLNIQPVLHAALGMLASAIVQHMQDAPDLDGVTAIERLRAAADLAYGDGQA